MHFLFSSFHHNSYLSIPQAFNDVQVIQGLQSGQEGVVTAVLRKENRIIIEGVNMVSMFMSQLTKLSQFNHGNFISYITPSPSFGNHNILEKKDCEAYG
jgi:hypothetical protein